MNLTDQEMVFAQLYDIFTAYNGAPENAKELFGCDLDNPLAIRSIFDKKIRAETNQSKGISLATSYTYARITALLSLGDEVEAKDHITMLIKNDDVILRLDEYAERAGVSYLEQCMLCKEFLTPEKLDARIFEIYAPESKDLSKDYIDKQGIAVISEAEGGFNLTLFYVKPQLGAGSKEFHFKLPFEEIEQKAKEFFIERKITDYSIIKGDKKIMPYLMSRIGTEQAGKAALEKIARGSSPTDGISRN